MPSKRAFDINRQTIKEPTNNDAGDVIESEDLEMHRGFNWKEASLTLALVIIAIWSAYFVTILLSGKAEVKSASVKKETPKTETPAADKTTLANPATDTPKDTAAKTTDPFSSLGSDADKIKETPADTNTPKEIAKDSFKIRILNGNGVVGDAAKLKKELTDKGFNVGDTANAKLKYTKTQVYYIAGKQKEAELVAQNLTGKQTEVKEAEQDLVGSNYQVLVVIGKS